MSAHCLFNNGGPTGLQKGDLLKYKQDQVVFLSVEREGDRIVFAGGVDKTSVPIKFSISATRQITDLMLSSLLTLRAQLRNDLNEHNQIVFEVV